jgi:hypothetical protein
MLTLGAADSVNVKQLSSVTAANAESSGYPHTDAGSCNCCTTSGSRVSSEFLLLTLRTSHMEMQMNYTGKNELLTLQMVIKSSEPASTMPLRRASTRRTTSSTDFVFRQMMVGIIVFHETSDLRLQDVRSTYQLKHVSGLRYMIQVTQN